MEVVFKFATDSIRVEVDGPEGFVKPHIDFLIPFVRSVTGAEGSREEAPSRGIDGVADWWEEKVPAGSNPSLQDTILLLAYYMRSFRKLVFVSDDIRRCFAAMGVEEPKSLLQILGTLKRDHGTLLNAGRRGEYMMNTTGIARARELLGESRGGSGPPPAAFASATKAVDARSLFRD